MSRRRTYSGELCLIGATAGVFHGIRSACGYGTDHMVLEKDDNTGEAKSLWCMTCGTVSTPGKREKKPKVKKEKTEKKEESR